MVHIGEELNKNEQLFQALYESIRKGELPGGSRLPSEVELARLHNCSRITVRSSLKQLENLKLIRRIRGNGTYVNAPEPERLTRRRNIAVVAEEVENYNYQNPGAYFGQLMMGLFHHGNTLDFSANFIFLHPGETFLSGFKRQEIDLADYDGLIFAKQLTREEVTALEGANRCFVTLQEPDEGLEVPIVMIDNHTGIYMATRHLLEQGRRNLYFLGGRLDDSVKQNRVAGFQQALREFGVPNPEARCLTVVPTNEDGVAAAVRELIAAGTPFDGLLVFSDLAAIGAVGVLREAGIGIPEQVALVMYNDFDLASRVLKLPITAVCQPFGELMRSALQMIIRRLNQPEKNRIMVQIIQPSLMIRRSSTVIPSTPQS